MDEKESNASSARGALRSPPIGARRAALSPCLEPGALGARRAALPAPPDSRSPTFAHRAPRCATRGYLRALAGAHAFPSPIGERRAERPRPRRAMRDYLRAPGGDLGYACIPTIVGMQARRGEAGMVRLFWPTGIKQRADLDRAGPRHPANQARRSHAGRGDRQLRRTFLSSRARPWRRGTSFPSRVRQRRRRTPYQTNACIPNRPPNGGHAGTDGRRDLAWLGSETEGRKLSTEKGPHGLTLPLGEP